MLDTQPEHSQTSLKSHFRQLYYARSQDRPRLFLEHCRMVVKAKNRGDLSIENAGFEIAETMFMHDLEEPLFDEIVALAGSLELPFHISGIQPSDGWNHLVQLIDEYDRRLGKR